MWAGPTQKKISSELAACSLTPGPPVDTGLSIDYDLATPVGLFRIHPLLFFLGPGLKGRSEPMFCAR